MTDAEFLQRVYLRIGGERESGILKPFLLAIVSDVLPSACKAIATHKPTGHQKILDDFTQITAFTVSDDSAYAVCDLPTNLIETDRLHRIHGQFQEGLNPVSIYEFYPVFSYAALKLATTHGMSYYFLENDKIYLAPLDGSAVLDSLDIRHYKYMTLAEYPVEMFDILFQELIPHLNLTPERMKLLIPQKKK